MASIVAALWMWSLGKQAAAKVRDRLSPFQVRGFAGATRWRSLARWARKLPWLSESNGVLGSARQRAERGVQIALSGLAQMPSTLAGPRLKTHSRRLAGWTTPSAASPHARKCAAFPRFAESTAIAAPLRDARSGVSSRELAAVVAAAARLG